MNVDAHRLERYWEALGRPSYGSRPSALFVVSLLPALAAGQALPVAEPRATINYGLNRLRPEKEVAIGDRLRMTGTITDAAWVGDPDQSPLQLVRSVEVENQRSAVVLTAETVARLVY
jgi:acyl dehydratase